MSSIPTVQSRSDPAGPEGDDGPGTGGPRPPFSLHALALDPARTTAAIEQAILGHVTALRRRGVVVGLSGGIDSTVVTYLSVRALGAARVQVLLMPERDSSPESLDLGHLVASTLGTPALVEDIGPVLEAAGCYARQIEAIRRVFPEYDAGFRCKVSLPSILDGDRLNVSTLTIESPSGERKSARLSTAAYLHLVAATNYKQRVRKMTEYYHADRLHYAVTGTPNRLEYDQGFFVKLGDGAADLKPIAHLYKTQVYALAEVPWRTGRDSAPPANDRHVLAAADAGGVLFLAPLRRHGCLPLRAQPRRAGGGGRRGPRSDRRTGGARVPRHRAEAPHDALPARASAAGGGGPRGGRPRDWNWSDTGMNVLVTGAAGYIGSVVTERLIGQGHQVVALDDLRHGHRDAVHPEARFVEGDLLDREWLMTTVRNAGADAVVHLAAEALIDESVRNPGTFFRVNTSGGLNLLDAMAAAGVRRLIFSSTAAVYGEPVAIPIREEAALVPVNAYGESKLAFERALPWYCRAHGIRHVSLRYFNACGATTRAGERHEPETHLIPIVMDVALGRREAIYLFGTDYDTPDGTCVRDYVHVLDIADAHLRCLERIDSIEPTAFNLGNGHGYSNREVIAAVERVTGRRVRVVDAPRRPGDPARLVASADRIARELDWRPAVTALDSMIASAWAWHLAMADGQRHTETEHAR